MLRYGLATTMTQKFPLFFTFVCKNATDSKKVKLTDLSFAEKKNKVSLRYDSHEGGWLSDFLVKALR